MIAIPPAAPPAQVSFCGPPAPRLMAGAAAQASFSLDRALRVAVREMAGAVVVVEDEATPTVPRLPDGLSLFHGRINLFGAREPLNGGSAALPIWRDPCIGAANVNGATRIYSMGGFGF